MKTSIRFSAPMAPPVSGASTRKWPEPAQASAELAHDGRAVRGQIDQDRSRLAAADAQASATAFTTFGVGRDSNVISVWAARTATSVAADAPATASIGRGVEVEDDDLIAVGDEVRRDGPADVAQPDNADRHRPSLSSKCPGRAPKRSPAESV